VAEQNKCDDAIVSADAPSQAHLQGTQSQHTKANLAKEPALFLRFRDTPCFIGHSMRFDTPDKGERTITKVSCCPQGKTWNRCWTKPLVAAVRLWSCRW